jgi:Mrp family chromosome partitioning ATPase
MRLLVEELKNRYEDRYVIFDATPAMFAAETAFLTSIVDAVLLVVRAGKTAKKSILQAMENIDRGKIIGVVFNASNASAIDYGHYYKYYRKK